MQSSPLTLGSVVRSVAAGGFDVVVSAYRPFESHPVHAHDTPAYVYVLDGSVSVKSTRMEQHCPRASMRFIPAGDRHQTRYGEASACLVMGIGDERWRAVQPRSTVLDHPAYHQPHAPVTAYAEMIHREMRVNDTATPLAVEALMLELVTSAMRSHPRSDRRMPTWLPRIRERIHSEFRRSISLQVLSADAGVHPVHLSRTFRWHFGCSIAEYQRRLRLDWARARLVTGDEPVGRIAVEAGFTDHSEFTRRFVDATGVTPSRFRSKRDDPVTSASRK